MIFLGLLSGNTYSAILKEEADTKGQLLCL